MANSLKSDTAPQDARRNEVRAVVLALLVAAIIRLAYFLQYRAHVPYFSATILDSTYYDAWALRVLGGHGYGPMPFYMAPLYPYFLAAVYYVAGHSYGAVYAVQMLIGLGNVLLTYVIARRLFGHQSGLLAMVMLALYAPVAYLETKLLTETLAIFLNLTSLLLLMKALERKSATGFLIAGLVMGLSAVCRPSALLTVGLIVVWLVVGLRNRRPGLLLHIGMLALGVALAILPVTVRNYVVGCDSALISTNGGIVFVQANHPGANGVSAAITGFSGSIMTQQREEMDFAQKALGHPVKPSESSAFWMGEGIKFIREQPIEFLKLIVMKMVWSVHGLEADCSYNVYLETRLVPALRIMFMPFALLAGLMLFGLIAARHCSDSDDRTILGLYILSVFLSMIIFSVTSRYRAPAVPGMCVFAGYGLAVVCRAFPARLFGVTLVATGCIVAFFLISLVPYPIPRVTATSLANLGSSYTTDGQLAEGIKVMDESLKLTPDQPFVFANMGISLILSGRPSDAAKQLARAVQILPENAVMRQNLGAALFRSRNLVDAEREYRVAVSLNNASAEAHAGLAETLSALGKSKEMEQEKKTVLRLSPDFAKARFDLANDFVGRHNPAEAIHQYRTALMIDPGFVEAYVNMGLALKDTGRLGEAVKAYRSALNINPGLVRAQNNLAVALYYYGKYAESWRAVHAARRLGGQLHPGFIKALSDKMAEPAE